MGRNLAAVDLDLIYRKARADLTLTGSRGESDCFLWEHSFRVAENAKLIARLPEAAARVPDPVVVAVAGLYHDAGWVVRCRNGEIDRAEVLLSPCNEIICEQGAALMERSLTPLLSPDTLERASHAMRVRLDRVLNMIEAEIVAEAENLEEFGVLPLWLSVRRGLTEGKGVQAVIDSWRRKQEYQFWRARLNDSFRFEQVRELARERLASMERLMADLEEQHSSRDLAKLTAAGADGAARLRP